MNLSGDYTWSNNLQLGTGKYQSLRAITLSTKQSSVKYFRFPGSPL